MKTTAFGECSPERQAEIEAFYVKAKGSSQGQKWAQNALCLETSELYLAGELKTHSEASIAIGYEYADDSVVRDRESPDFDEELVSELEEALEGVIPELLITFAQLDIKAASHSRFTKYIDMGLAPQISLDLNEFTDTSDYIGLFETDMEPQVTFTIGQLTFKEIEPELLLLPDSRFVSQIVLGDWKTIQDRRVYSFMALLGDFGGFNDGVVLLPTFFLTMYSSRMFMRSNGGDLPTKQKRKPRSTSSDLTIQKFAEMAESVAAAPTVVTRDDAEQLAKESERMSNSMTPWCLSMCYTKKLCGRKRAMDAQ